MKVAVVTPYYNESQEVLGRCMTSVLSQEWPWSPLHILVADRETAADPLPLNCGQLVHLGCNHNDAGATPRAIGAISAFSQGYDAVAFLDADNSYEPTHISNMIQTCKETKCDLVSATRNIYSKFNNQFLYIDTIESNGIDFCDTNCLFVTRELMPLMTHWITSKDLYLAGDRVFWNLVNSNKEIRKSRCTIPTVNYYSRWAWHHQHANVNIPDDSIWMKTDPTGKVTTHKHKEQ